MIGMIRNVLIACEESQRVCIAFREKGFNAYSCDIMDPSGGHPEWHIKADVLPLLNGKCEFNTMGGQKHTIDGKWDLIIAHPPCTYLSNCATRSHSAKMTPIPKINNRTMLRIEAMKFFMQFIMADCDKIAIENPVGVMNTCYRKPDQIIQPYFFAESENDIENYYQKRTCLWLKGLPKLERSTDLPVPPPMYIRQGVKSKGKKIGWCEGIRNIRGGQAERAKARSKTFPGIARAMAEQWEKVFDFDNAHDYFCGGFVYSNDKED